MFSAFHNVFFPPRVSSLLWSEKKVNFNFTNTQQRERATPAQFEFLWRKSWFFVVFLCRETFSVLLVVVLTWGDFNSTRLFLSPRKKIKLSTHRTSSPLRLCELDFLEHRDDPDRHRAAISLQRQCCKRIVFFAAWKIPSWLCKKKIKSNEISNRNCCTYNRVTFDSSLSLFSSLCFIVAHIVRRAAQSKKAFENLRNSKLLCACVLATHCTIRAKLRPIWAGWKKCEWNFLSPPTENYLNAQRPRD